MTATGSGGEPASCSSHRARKAREWCTEVLILRNASLRPEPQEARCRAGWTERRTGVGCVVRVAMNPWGFALVAMASMASLPVFPLVATPSMSGSSPFVAVAVTGPAMMFEFWRTVSGERRLVSKDGR
jgi:hypothetical protein